jgi:hypothetical protein
MPAYHAPKSEERMMGNSLMSLVGVGVLGLVYQILKFSLNKSARNGRSTIARINDMDAHLSFDERVAERMRELGRETERGDIGPSARPVQGFGRRGA